MRCSPPPFSPPKRRRPGRSSLKITLSKSFSPFSFSQIEALITTYSLGSSNAARRIDFFVSGCIEPKVLFREYPSCCTALGWLFEEFIKGRRESSASDRYAPHLSTGWAIRSRLKRLCTPSGEPIDGSVHGTLLRWLLLLFNSVLGITQESPEAFGIAFYTHGTRMQVWTNSQCRVVHLRNMKLYWVRFCHRDLSVRNPCSSQGPDYGRQEPCSDEYCNSKLPDTLRYSR